MSSGREFQSVNALLKDLSRPQFVFDLIDLIVSFGAGVMSMKSEPRVIILFLSLSLTKLCKKRHRYINLLVDRFIQFRSRSA